VVGIHGGRLAEIERRLRENDVAIIRPPDKRERPDLYFAVDGHWNQAGHALVAESVLSELDNVGVL